MEHKKSRLRWLTIGVAAVLLVSMLIGGAIGKYVTTVTVSGKVTFTAELAEKIELLEHAATRNADGSYTLSTSETVTENTYTLLPGLDIPKDPYITITGKTPLDAYLFIEVVDTLAEQMGETTYTPITYTISSEWKKLDDVTGKNGGAVYVYTGNTGSAKVLDEEIGSSFAVYLLAPLVEDEPETIRVSQKLITQSVSDDSDLLTFYACMGETALGNDAAAVYNAIQNIT